MIVKENIAVEYFLDLRNFGSRIVVGVNDTQVVVDKLHQVSFVFQTEDTVARKNLSFVTMGVLAFYGSLQQQRVELREMASGFGVVAKSGETPCQNGKGCLGLHFKSIVACCCWFMLVRDTVSAASFCDDSVSFS
ncbi:hypothetical protein Tco_0601624 [Tanacetum coccineum]